MGGCLAAEDDGGGRQLEVVSRAGMHAALCLLLGLWANKERSNLSCAWPGQPAPVRHRLARMP